MAAINATLEHISVVVGSRLKALMDERCEPGVLKDAMSYSLLAGGKRLRPALCMLSAGLFGDMSKALDLGCAIEMIHTYSLIHDDLPAMDNDVLRRGKPTNHVVFGEAVALLAGDGLLNGAFEVMLAAAQKEPQLHYLGAMHIVASAAGIRGMIAGQTVDLEFEGSDVDETVLHYIHERKTAAMIKASVAAGAVLLGANEDDVDALAVYGESIGLVFQIVDDILDEVGDQGKLGKSVGKDKDAEKMTFTRVYGLDESRRIAGEKTQLAIDSLSHFGSRADNLRAVAQYLLERDR